MAQVIVPQAAKKKESLLDLIKTGLGVASSIYGIRAADQKIDLLATQQEDENIKLAESKARQTGLATPLLQQELAAKGFALSREQAPGFRQIGADESGAPVFAQSPQGAKSAALASKNQAAISRSQGIRLEDKSQEEKEKVANATRDFTTHKNVNKAMIGFDAGNQVKRLLSENSPVLDQIGLRRIFRLSGDVGAIRAEDLKQLGSSPAWIERGVALINKGLTGQTIEPNERRALVRFADDMQETNKQIIEKEADRLAGSLAQETTLNRTEILTLLDPLQVLPEAIQFDVAKFGGTPTQQNSNTTLSGTNIIPRAQAAPPAATDEDAINSFLGQ